MVDINNLWSRFCPTTVVEMVQRGNFFLEMTQGFRSIRDLPIRLLQILIAFVFGYRVERQ